MFNRNMQESFFQFLAIFILLIIIDQSTKVYIVKNYDEITLKILTYFSFF